MTNPYGEATRCCVAVLIASVSLLLSSALAQQPPSAKLPVPLSWKGIALGGHAEGDVVAQLSCRERKASDDFQWCHDLVDLDEGRWVAVDLRFDDPDQKFSWLEGFFPANSWDALKDSLIAKFGAPSTTRLEPVQSAFGPTKQNEVLRWIRKDGILDLSRYGSTVEQGIIIMGTNEEFARRKVRDDEQTKKSHLAQQPPSGKISVPLSWKGIALGGHAEDDVVAQLLSCRERRPSDAFQWCHDLVDLEDARWVAVDLRFDDPDRKFSWMEGFFPENSWDALKNALIAKFGAASTTRVEPVQNVFGATRQNEVLTWVRKNGVLSVSQYGSTVEQGIIMMGTNEEFARRKSVDDNQAKQNAKKF